jgi:hypothetical protein
MGVHIGDATTDEPKAADRKHGASKDALHSAMAGLRIAVHSAAAVRNIGFAEAKRLNRQR